MYRFSTLKKSNLTSVTVYLCQVSAIVEFLDTYIYYSKPNVCRRLNGLQLHNKGFLVNAGVLLRTSAN